ncbi:MAG: flavodoxin family protein [Chloroflexi bacterium]|nr:flavodoxin family protein [Chloroflexota bacterium]
MRILGICCSPRKGGNTEILLQQALQGAAEAGAETEMFTVYDKDLKPCDGCNACRKEGVCHVQDDMQPLYGKLQAAQGIVYASPVYFWSVTSQGKMILDRLNSYYALAKLSGKVGGAIAVAGALGHVEVRNLLYSFFAWNHMFIADFVPAFATDKKEVRRDRHAMTCANLLGQKMVSIARAQQSYPEAFRIPLTVHVRDNLKIPSAPAKGRFQVGGEGAGAGLPT